MTGKKRGSRRNSSVSSDTLITYPLIHGDFNECTTDLTDLEDSLPLHVSTNFQIPPSDDDVSSASDMDEEGFRVVGHKKRSKKSFTLKITLCTNGESISPLKLAAAFSKELGHQVKGRLVGNGICFVTLESLDDVILLKSLKTLLGKEISVRDGNSFVQPKKGLIIGLPSVIRGFPVEDSTIVEELESFGVTSARRMHRFVPSSNGSTQKVPTNRVVLTFSDSQKEIPKEVTFCFRNYAVRPYLDPPIQCFRCQRFGHSGGSCRSSTLSCKICSGDHFHKNCPKIVTKCANCDGLHPSTFARCPKKIETCKINSIRVKDNVPWVVATKRHKANTEIQTAQRTEDRPSLLNSLSSEHITTPNMSSPSTALSAVSVGTLQARTYAQVTKEHLHQKEKYPSNILLNDCADPFRIVEILPLLPNDRSVDSANTSQMDVALFSTPKKNTNEVACQCDLILASSSGESVCSDDSAVPFQVNKKFQSMPRKSCEVACQYDLNSSPHSKDLEKVIAQLICNDEFLLRLSNNVRLLLSGGL